MDMILLSGKKAVLNSFSFLLKLAFIFYILGVHINSTF
jgi:hypothetical protein